MSVSFISRNTNEAVKMLSNEVAFIMKNFFNLDIPKGDEVLMEITPKMAEDMLGYASLITFHSYTREGRKAWEIFDVMKNARKDGKFIEGFTLG